MALVGDHDRRLECDLAAGECLYARDLHRHHHVRALVVGADDADLGDAELLELLYALIDQLHAVRDEEHLAVEVAACALGDRGAENHLAATSRKSEDHAPSSGENVIAQKADGARLVEAKDGADHCPYPSSKQLPHTDRFGSMRRILQLGHVLDMSISG